MRAPLCQLSYGSTDIMVGTVGFEPTTYRLSDDCSTTELRPYGRGGEDRTPDTLFVGQVLFR